MRLALISLERWDGVWRRNQHLTAQLVRQHLAESVTFVEPPTLRDRGTTSWSPHDGVTVVRPALPVPKRLGGLRLAARLLQASALRDADVLWVNDPTLGVHCLAPGQPALYDVTDDWRTFAFPARIRRRIARAEDRLARQATTIVCSEVLRERWQQRYGVTPPVIHNGIDEEAWAAATPFDLPGTPPHVGYLGTLHAERLDLGLVHRLADDDRVGTLHLVGPNALPPPASAMLEGHPRIRLHGPVDAREVPAWTKSMDALISPHAVTDFTLSLDAIKSYEYLASGRPIVATATSGFQRLTAAQLTVCEPVDFADAVARAVSSPLPPGGSDAGSEWSWAHRARQFWGDVAPSPSSTDKEISRA